MIRGTRLSETACEGNRSSDRVPKPWKKNGQIRGTDLIGNIDEQSEIQILQAFIRPRSTGRLNEPESPVYMK